MGQKERNKYQILMHICGILKNATDEPICRQEERHRPRKDHGHSGEGTGKMKWVIRLTTTHHLVKIVSGTRYKAQEAYWFSVMT